MAHTKKQDIIIGSGASNPPILAKENAPTVELSKLSQPSTSIEEGSTKPVTIAEALSLLQTLAVDLRGLGCEVTLLAKERRVYVIIQPPVSIGIMGMKNGHITVNGTPVSEVK